MDAHATQTGQVRLLAKSKRYCTRRTTAIDGMAVVVMDKAPYHVRLTAPALKDLGKKTRDELIEVVRKVGLKRQM